MKKHYLKTIEDVLALNDTDTKIYEEHATWYYHCSRLTPSEVAELTGYKVEESE